MDEDTTVVGKKVGGKQHNILPIWGNEASMNLNPLILANIQGSSYFKVHLFKLKTYHEVVDEIYYQVKHLEPWERGSRKTSGQTGMCGGVRGVGAGGIVSTAYCLLYKLYTLRLTRKQVNGLLNHGDSPYIRALGFMYLRYTQPPGDLYSWYEDYLLDDEEIDVKAGGGQTITIGQMVYQFLAKLDWFSTLFPRIPVPIQKQIEKKLDQYCHEQGVTLNQLSSGRGGVGVGLTSGSGSGAGGSGYGIGGSGSGGGMDYDGSYDRRGGGASSGRDYHSNRSIPSNTTQYRTEHDDRDGRYGNSSTSSYQRRYDEVSTSPSAYRDYERDRHRDKHKKKKKHKHHSRSRSRSRGQSRSRARSNSRSRSPYQRHRSDRDYDRRYENKYNRDDHMERRYR